MKTGRISGRVCAAGAAVLIAGLGLGGCASQQSMDQIHDANRSLTEQNNDLRRQNQELNSELGLIQKDRTAKENLIAEQSNQLARLKDELRKMGVSYDDLTKRMGGIGLSPLDETTDQALAALAAQYPDLIKYDSQRGMLRFASDLTFASGQDSVQEAARQSLQALGKILSSGPAMQYEVMVLGHTDAQKISTGTAAKHPTNMHLSAHRAIAVRDVLAQMGVPQEKMFVAGWGEYRPTVPNSGPKGNTPQNRRVEIYLTRPTNTGSMSESTEPATPPPSRSAAPDREAPPSRQPDLTK
jgi:chemotaxis protein MotB